MSFCMEIVKVTTKIRNGMAEMTVTFALQTPGIRKLCPY